MNRRYRPVISVLAFCGAIVATPPWVIAIDPSIVGEWGPLFDFKSRTVHMIQLKTGKVLCVGKSAPFFFSPSPYVIFDPTDDSFNDPPYLTPEQSPGVAEHNLYCSGHAPLADGRILFTGGLGEEFGEKATVFDPDAGPQGAWELQDIGPAPRFYPTCTRQADGTMLVIAGGLEEDTRIPTVFDITKAAGQQWTQLSDAQYCDTALDCLDPPDGPYNFYIHQYPFMYYLSNGLLFAAGEEDSLTDFTSRTLNPTSQAWVTLFGEADEIVGDSSVMYRPDSIIKAGGYDAAGAVTAKVIQIDAASATPSWNQLSDMNHARRDFYLISLPDGKVLAVGGNQDPDDGDSDPVYEPELFDPDNPSAGWSDMAWMADGYGREEHSSAVLLPDARVLIAGGDDSGPDCETAGNCGHTAQVFTPPYLFAPPGTTFDHPRPVIESVSPISYRMPFTVQSNIASDIVAVSLIGTGAATHSFDHNQRFINLSFTYKTGNTIRVAAPANSDQAPPGYYMLFLIDDHGRPSVAEIVQIS